jgi:DNA-binding response OmpR family regulator
LGADSPDSPLPQRERPRILVIDDHPQTRLLLHDALEDEGYDAQLAAGVADALESAQRQRVDLVLLDAHLAGEHAADFVSGFRALQGPDTPILLLTGLERPQQVAAALGADAYLQKPFDLGELLDTLARLTGQA